MSGAVKHGLTAKLWLLKGENRTVFNKMAGKLYKNLLPTTELQAHLVDFIIAEIWRLYRIGLVESQMFDLIMNNGLVSTSSKRDYADAFIRMTDKDLINKLTRYKLSSENALFRKLKELRQLKEEKSLVIED